MSESRFKKETEIFLSKTRAPISFTHKRDLALKSDFVLHLNNHIEIYVYLAGDTDYIVGEQYIPLEHGDVVVVLPHEVHVPVIKSESVYERIYMLLPIDSFSDLPFDPIAKFACGSEHKLSLCKPEKASFLSLMRKISAISESSAAEGGKMQLTGLFLQAIGILSEALRSGRKEDASVVIPSGIPKQMLGILTYISTHIEEIESVESVAKHFFITPQYLSSYFKKNAGINISEYLQIKKIALSKTLLEGGKSVAEVAFECGFSDSSHFIKNFRRFVGMTPKQYQNSLFKK